MANYGRGWGDGYGSQSPESIKAYQEREGIEAAQIQASAAHRRRTVASCMSEDFDEEGQCLRCGYMHDQNTDRDDAAT